MTKAESTAPNVPVFLSPDQFNQLFGHMTRIDKKLDFLTANGNRADEDVSKENAFDERDRNFINTLNSYFGNRMRFNPVTFDTSSKSFVKPRPLEEFEPEEVRKEIEVLKNQLYQIKSNERLDKASKDFATKDIETQIKNLEKFLSRAC